MSRQRCVLWNSYKYLKVSDLDKKFINTSKRKKQYRAEKLCHKPDMSTPTFNKGKCKKHDKIKICMIEILCYS